VPDGDTYALICGGGTAGHVLPAISIAGALVERGHPPESLHFVGSAGRIEATLVPESGYEITLLPGRGIQRKLTFENLGAIFGILRAVAKSVALVRRLRPRVVLVMGGYASVPCGLAAALWRVPIVVAEQNAVPGLANRLVARFAKVAAVAFPGTPLPRAVVTGNPVRAEVLAVDRARDGLKARAALGIAPGRQVVLVAGGSLGALRINEATLAAASMWGERGDLAVRHAVGERDWERLAPTMPHLPDGGLQYLPVRYEDDMPRALAAADVAVTRAGSGTCFELAAVGLPAVIVPSPFVTGDHQTANARFFAEAGAAVVVPNAELDGARLVAEVDALLADPSRMDAMAAGAHSLARPDAAEAIADLVEAHAR
jgi:UDP-N-acetylglucosamine--N-acetylmuramyl-(pentapeptide) pyrophosphoryl-undecaprenol N-acetylglucosamine transferase